jgi:hypothetical protein
LAVKQKIGGMLGRLMKCQPRRIAISPSVIPHLPYNGKFARATLLHIAAALICAKAFMGDDGDNGGEIWRCLPARVCCIVRAAILFLVVPASAEPQFARRWFGRENKTCGFLAG